MLLCVCFLRLPKTKFHDTMGKEKCCTVCFSLFLQYIFIVLVLGKSKVCLSKSLKGPFFITDKFARSMELE